MAFEPPKVTIKGGKRASWDGGAASEPGSAGATSQTREIPHSYSVLGTAPTHVSSSFRLPEGHLRHSTDGPMLCVWLTPAKGQAVRGREGRARAYGQPEWSAPSERGPERVAAERTVLDPGPRREAVQVPSAPEPVGSAWGHVAMRSVATAKHGKGRNGLDRIG